MNQILASFQNIQVRDVIDILLVAAVFYGIFRFLRETRAQQLFRGIVLIFIFNGLTGALRLYTINWILNGAITMSEESDAFVIVVSEETGDISYAEHGKLSRYVDEDLLREKLTSIYQKDDSGFFLQNLMEGVNHEEKE